MTIYSISLTYIIPNPWQTRLEEPDQEYIQSLALDIVDHGLLQTPVGRLLDEKGKVVGSVQIEAHGGLSSYLTDNPGARVQLAFGHNRLAAYRWLDNEQHPAELLGDWTVIPVDVRALSDEQLADLAWAENDKRKDCTPLERSMAIRKRMEDFKWSQKEIAEHLGISAPVVSNALRLLDLPEDILQLVAKGGMSERAAISLLTLYDLPESLRQEAEKSYYQDAKPSSIIAQAIHGVSSDNIREKIELLVRNHSKDLQRALWPLDYIFITNEAIYWPECRTCELRHKPLNVCTNPACYAAKSRVWESDYLQQASQTSGIIPLEPEISSYQVTNFSYHRTAASILASGCENLRLTFVLNSASRECTLKDKGFPHALIVCQKGSGHCHCLKGLEILEAQRRREAVQAVQNTPSVEDPTPAVTEEADEDEQPSVPEPAQPEPAQPTPEELQELVRQERKNKKEYERLAEEAKVSAAAIIAKGLEDNDPGAWRLIYNRVALGERWDQRPDDISGIRKGIAEKIIKYHVQYRDVSQVVDSLKELLIDAGLQMPVF